MTESRSTRRAGAEFRLGVLWACGYCSSRQQSLLGCCRAAQMASVEASPGHYLKLDGAQIVGSMQAGSGECSRQSLPRPVRGIAGEAEEQEQGVARLLSISEKQCSERHAQLSGSPLLVGAVVAACLSCLPSARPPQLARHGLAPLPNPYPRCYCQKQRTSQLKGYLHERSALMSPRRREDLDAGE
jgi:hypothetical protein